MYDPNIVAHEINWPIKNKYGHRRTLVTIWHIDPEKDGTDDSCGWFCRSRHGDQNILKGIVSEFLFNHKHNYWFTQDGYRHFSTSGIVLNMYHAAAWIFFKRHRARYKRFMRRYLFDILHFAENSFDSIGDYITRKYGGVVDEEEIKRLAGIVFSDILRKTRPWYKHPRWHIHHWKVVIHWPRWFRKKQHPRVCRRIMVPTNRSGTYNRKTGFAE